MKNYKEWRRDWEIYDKQRGELIGFQWCRICSLLFHNQTYWFQYSVLNFLTDPATLSFHTSSSFLCYCPMSAFNQSSIKRNQLWECQELSSFVMVSWREDSQPKLTVCTTPVLMLFLQYYASKKWFLFRFGRFTILQWVVAAIFYWPAQKFIGDQLFTYVTLLKQK